MSTAVTKAATHSGAKKSKKASAPKSKNHAQHPPYFEMITDAIVTLKDRTGSSSQAIAKFNEQKYKSLPANFKKLLSVQLKKNVADGKLVKVKNSFKLPPKKMPAESSAPTKKPKALAKPASKKAPAKVAAKPKAKAPAAKTNATTAKPKAAAKPKAKTGAKPKAAVKTKTPSNPTAKSSRASTRSTPGRTSETPKAVTKKVPATKKTVAPKKAAAATKKGKK